MFKPTLANRLVRWPAALLLGAGAPSADAQTQALTPTEMQLPTQAQPPTPTQAPVTLELLHSRGKLSAGQPDAHATNFRGTWVFGDGQVAQVEVLDETKFNARGGIVAGSYTRVFDPDWYATGTLAFGHGGPNWANRRIDLDVATKWRAARDIVSHVALYGATYDADRSDRGLRVSLVAYLPGPTVVEGGITLNVSDPGAVRSQMPFVSVTWGREGEQYLSLRLSSGTEAYQALGASQQLVDFHSSSLGLAWRRWVDRRWGFIATAESYRNPTYKRNTFGAGLLVQF